MKIPKKGKILVISHGYRLTSGGPSQDIRDYLLNKVARIDYIDHPFPHANYQSSHFFFYEDGKLQYFKKIPLLASPEIFRYLQQFLTTFFFLLFNKTKYDVCFALDNHSVLATAFFRKIGLIKKLVYYSIDYTPQRFNSKFMNSLYHFTDRVACKSSDINWVVARHMIKAREKNSVDIGGSAQFREVPMGFRKREVKVLPLSKISFFNLVYIGTILEKQGLQLVVESLPRLLMRFPRLHLTIIGTGDYEDKLKGQIADLNLGAHVTFKGFIGNRQEVFEILTKESVGLAPYKPIPGSFSYYGDPSKIKIYLGCGLPVITTHVTAFSKVLEKAKAGIVIEYKIDDFCKAVTKLLKSKETYKRYRNSALTLSNDYVTEEILKNAIEKI